MGEPLTSTEVKNSTEFLRLQDQYKGEIVEDKRLTKAAELAAKQHMILKNNQDDGMKEARLRGVHSQFQKWTQRVRQPFGPSGGSGTGGTVLDEDDFEAAPVQALVKQLIKTIKKPTKQEPTQSMTPANRPNRKRRLPTPVVTPTPRRPKKPETPLSGFNPLNTFDEDDDEPPEKFIERSYQRLFPDKQGGSSSTSVKSKVTQQAKTALKRKGKQAVTKKGKQLLGRWLEYK